jgi:hypothetical protein
MCILPPHTINVPTLDEVRSKSLYNNHNRDPNSSLRVPGIVSCIVRSRVCHRVTFALMSAIVSSSLSLFLAPFLRGCHPFPTKSIHFAFRLVFLNLFIPPNPIPAIPVALSGNLLMKLLDLRIYSSFLDLRI